MSNYKAVILRKHSRIKIFVCLVLVLVFGFMRPHALFSQEIKNPYVPGEKPDRINLTVTEDPSASAAVTWRTSIEVKEAYAEIVIADINPLSIRKARLLKAETQTIRTKS